MSIQLQPPPKSLIKTEPEIKSEPPEYENFIDILDSSDKEIIPDIKNVDIVSHILYKDSIKSETVPKDILETEYLESVETQVIVKTENAPFIKQEILNEDFNTLDNLETDEQLAANFSNNFNGISVSSMKSEYPERTDFAGSYRTCKTDLWEEDKEKIKVIEAPVIPVEPHEYTSLDDGKHICNHCQITSNKLEYVKLHIKKKHREDTTMYQCPYCSHKSKYRSNLRAHIIRKHKDTKYIQWFECHLCDKKFKIKEQLTKHTWVHLTHEQIQDRLELCSICGSVFKTLASLRKHAREVHNKEPKKRMERQESCQMDFEPKHEYSQHDNTKYKNQLEMHTKTQEKRYHCDKCDFKTHKLYNLNTHKLIHLKPEEIQYFCCYHCSFKSKHKQCLKTHIFRHHFKNREIKHHNKGGKTKYEYQHETPIKGEEKMQYFCCYHCSYKSTRKYTLRRHIFQHFKNKKVTFHCYICDFSTLKRESIMGHIQKHSKVQTQN